MLLVLIWQLGSSKQLSNNTFDNLKTVRSFLPSLKSISTLIWQTKDIAKIPDGHLTIPRHLKGKTLRRLVFKVKRPAASIWQFLRLKLLPVLSWQFKDLRKRLKKKLKMPSIRKSWENPLFECDEVKFYVWNILNWWLFTNNPWLIFRLTNLSLQQFIKKYDFQFLADI